jgi:lysophospholipase L1-like esterase
MRTSLVLLTLVISACASPASDPNELPPKAPYLALGDSIAFGFDPLVDHRVTPPTAYPELVAATEGLEVVNVACPGEASGGFILLSGNDNHCRENRIAYPLHVAYDGTQLEFALDFLRENPDTQLVTINIGANDLSKLVDDCGTEPTCVLRDFITVMLAYTHNLNTIFRSIREVYAGRLVALTTYNPFPDDQTAIYALGKLNAELTTQVTKFDGVVADGMAAFNAASNGVTACAAGLLIRMPDGTCDVHPSPAGDRVLADAIVTALAR